MTAQLLQADSATPLLSAQPTPAYPKLRGGDILASGFGITAAVWAAAYICRLPFLLLPGQLTIAAMIAAVLIGGFVAARYSPKGFWCAMWAGALSGFLDLLIVGSLMEDYVKNHQQVGHGAVPAAALWVLGSVALNTVAASLGGLLGQFFPSPRRAPTGQSILWTNIFALILVSLTLMLIGAGGLVTAHHAGLAVPDWPTSYNYNMFLLPFSLMQQTGPDGNSGIFYEHAHRLIASLVGFTALALAIHTTLVEPRRWVKLFAWAIGFGVLIQAILGGLRVSEISLTLAIVHGIFAQVVFAGMAALAAFTTRSFYSLQPIVRPEASTDRGLSLLLLLALLIQLVLGAIVRHTNTSVLLHITMATLVTCLILACGFRAWGLYGNLPPLYRAGLAVMAVLLLQLILGVLALVFWTGNTKDAPLTSAIFTTLHQMNGALLLATSTLLMLWNWRLLSRPADDSLASLRPAAL